MKKVLSFFLMLFATLTSMAQSANEPATYREFCTGNNSPAISMGVTAIDGCEDLLVWLLTFYSTDLSFEKGLDVTFVLSDGNSIVAKTLEPVHLQIPERQTVNSAYEYEGTLKVRVDKSQAQQLCQGVSSINFNTDGKTYICKTKKPLTFASLLEGNVNISAETVEEITEPTHARQYTVRPQVQYRTVSVPVNDTYRAGLYMERSARCEFAAIGFGVASGVFGAACGIADSEGVAAATGTVCILSALAAAAFEVAGIVFRYKSGRALRLSASDSGVGVKYKF